MWSCLSALPLCFHGMCQGNLNFILPLPSHIHLLLPLPLSLSVPLLSCIHIQEWEEYVKVWEHTSILQQSGFTHCQINIKHMRLVWLAFRIWDGSFCKYNKNTKVSNTKTIYWILSWFTYIFQFYCFKDTAWFALLKTLYVLISLAVYCA